MHTFTKDDCELHASKSKAVPNSITLLVVGPTEQSVAALIEEIMGNSGNSYFSVPLAYPDGQWGSFGRVSQ